MSATEDSAPIGGVEATSEGPGGEERGRPPRRAPGIRTYVRHGLVVALVAAIVSGGTGLFAVVTISSAVDRIVHSLDPLQNENAAIVQALSSAESGIRGYELSGNPAFLDQYQDGLAAYEREITSALRAAGNDRAAEAAIANIQVQSDGWLAIAGPLASQPVMPRQTAAAVAGLQRAFSMIETSTTAAATEISEEIRGARANADSTERIALVVVSAAALLSLTLAGVFGLRARRTLVLPLESLVLAISRLRGGDRHARVDLDGPAEVQAAGQALNALAERLGGDDRRRDRIRALSELITRDVREHIDLGELLREAVASIGVAFAVDRVFVRLAEGGTIGAIAAEWHRSTLPDLGPLADRPAEIARTIEEAATRGESMVIEDVTTHDFFSEPTTRSYLAVLGLRAAVISPITAAGELIGSLVIVDGQVHRWEEDEVGLITVAGEELGRALQHAQLFSAQRELVAQLQELDRSKSEFLSTVSHELRTPLTSITGYVEMLEEGEAGPVTEQQMKMLEIVDRNARRLRGLIEDLLTLSRIEVGAFRLNLEPVEIGEVIASTLQTMAPTLRDKGLKLETEVSTDLGLIDADRNQIERALLNLLSNAAKFTPSGGAIRIRAVRFASELHLSISDTGIGIPPDELLQLSTRFFRASNATERAIPGTGLGLTIVRSIVEHHGGELEITSELGVGTTSTIRLPAERRAQSRGPGARPRPSRRQEEARSGTMANEEGVVPT